MPRTAPLPPMDRPSTDELVVRYRLISLRALRDADETAAACTSTNPTIFDMQASPLRDQPNRAERAALAVCGGCPIADLCLVRDMRETPTVFDVQGVRAGLRQSERRALYLALEREGLL